jgi:hypothetical protein
MTRERASGELDMISPYPTVVFVIKLGLGIGEN